MISWEKATLYCEKGNPKKNRHYNTICPKYFKMKKDKEKREMDPIFSKKKESHNSYHIDLGYAMGTNEGISLDLYKKGNTLNYGVFFKQMEINSFQGVKVVEGNSLGLNLQFNPFSSTERKSLKNSFTLYADVGILNLDETQDYEFPTFLFVGAGVSYHHKITKYNQLFLKLQINHIYYDTSGWVHLGGSSIFGINFNF